MMGAAGDEREQRLADHHGEDRSGASQREIPLLGRELSAQHRLSEAA